MTDEKDAKIFVPARIAGAITIEAGGNILYPCKNELYLCEVDGLCIPAIDKVNGICGVHHGITLTGTMWLDTSLDMSIQELLENRKYPAFSERITFNTTRDISEKIIKEQGVTFEVAQQSALLCNEVYPGGRQLSDILDTAKCIDNTIPDKDELDIDALKEVLESIEESVSFAVADEAAGEAELDACLCVLRDDWLHEKP